MATTSDYVEFVYGQIVGAGAVRYKKMFGEYMVYVDDKPILLVCDNTVCAITGEILVILPSGCGPRFRFTTFW